MEIEIFRTEWKKYPALTSHLSGNERDKIFLKTQMLALEDIETMSLIDTLRKFFDANDEIHVIDESLKPETKSDARFTLASSVESLRSIVPKEIKKMIAIG